MYMEIPGTGITAWVADETDRLTDNYPCAYTDFWGSRIPCVYKTGSLWPALTPAYCGYWRSRIVREARPVYGHPISPSWLSTGQKICDVLDHHRIKWTSVDPLAFADAEEAEPLCPLLIYIGVLPRSLPYDDAVVIAGTVKEILADTGHPDVEVALAESLYRGSSRERKWDPLDMMYDFLDDHLALCKPFTATLGIPIAPLGDPQREGTGALYYRIGAGDRERIVLLTCAHVVCLDGCAGQAECSARQEVIAPGEQAFKDGLEHIQDIINDSSRRIRNAEANLHELGHHIEGEPIRTTEKRELMRNMIKWETARIEEANTLRDTVKTTRSRPEERVIGSVLHVERNDAPAEAYGYPRDFALVEMYKEKMDWSTFHGNKVFIGDNLTSNQFRRALFPQGYAHGQYPNDGLLQARGIVTDDEFRNPQGLDKYNKKCLLVVKTGALTGTTVGRVNGLESFTRIYDDHGAHHTSTQFAVLCLERNITHFSCFAEQGDSGSIVLTGDGRIVGLLTGGAGPSESPYNAVSYITPYWWVEQQIKTKFPDCSLYDGPR
ncbi:hypothetical protein EV714DRAFT_255093 [Schizophyllum commune]